ncbi:MAG TPA: putative sulfate exporter family transporter [Planctomycetota bacterium]|nr:putative sulfate exporter family transporter [Planctomycetota bacterium]
MSDSSPAGRSKPTDDPILGVPFGEAHRLLPGAGLAAAIVAASAWAASTGKSPLPTATLAIVIGLVIANSLRLGPAFRPGLDFCVKRVLRFGIVLVGIRLSLVEVAEKGAAAVPAVLICVAAGMAVALLLARRLGLSSRLGTLAAASTGICGVTAALAVAPVVDAEEREVAYTVGCVTLYGLIGMLLYPFAAHALFGDAPAAAGLFLGTSIHETAQVTGAALAYKDSWGSPEAFDAAMVAKLFRNATLVAVVPILGWVHARGSGAAGRRTPLARLFPLFVLGFLGMAIFRTIGDAGIARGAPLGVLDLEEWKISTKLIEWLATGACLPAAMAALGLGIRLAALKDLGLRPLLLGAGAATAVALAALACAAVVARL